MGAYTIKAVQKIPATREVVWDYFSGAANLQSITPAEMKFRVISQHHEEKIYAGQIIEYKVSPLFGIPVYWMTEITHVMDGEFFADEQRYGPYGMWHHQHFFKSIPGGTEMIDLIHYKNPLGILGKIANGLFVRNKLRGIFEYRFERIGNIFGKWSGQEQAHIEID
jgi:ligand-binding SRPBCC domain-containing protein